MFVSRIKFLKDTSIIFGWIPIKKFGII